MRVLLIEDEPTTAKAIEMMLTTEGFNVYQTDLGEEGLDLGKLYDYDIILLDPPAFGRGPGGEVWQLFEHLPAMVEACRAILSPKPLAMVLTAYSIRASFFAIHELVRDRFTGMGGTVESGELILREQSAGRALSTSLFSRWVP